MVIGKREKIVIFGIAGFLLIAAVHFLIFSKKVKAIRTADSKYRNAKMSVSTMKQVRDTANPTSYNAQTTENFYEPFTEIVENFDIKPPEVWATWFADSGNIELMDAAFNEYFERVDELKQLQADGEQGRGARLSFLNSGSFSWNFPRELPSAVRAGRADLFDLLATLKGQYDTVEAAAASAFRARALQNYNFALYSLDINFNTSVSQQPNIPASYFDIYQMFGPLAYFMKITEHSRMYFKEQASGNQMFNNLYEIMLILGFNEVTSKQVVPELKDMLFGPPNQPAAIGEVEINLTKAGFGGTFLGESIALYDIRQFMYYYQAQLETLIDLIKIANRAGIREVSFVRCRQATVVGAVENVGTAGTPTPTPTPTPFMEFEQGSMEMYEFYQQGGGAGFAGRAAPKKEPDEPVAVATPIDIVIVGDNASTSQFLYDITHIHRPYELDSWRQQVVQAQNNQGTLLRTTISLNVIADVLSLTEVLKEIEAIGATPTPYAPPPQ
jgi:hypothetical protein